jgi:tight adherence protein C
MEALLWLLGGGVAIGAFVLALQGLGALADVRASLVEAHFAALEPPPRWALLRAFAALVFALPAFLLPQGEAFRVLLLVAAAGAGYAAAPTLLRAAVARTRASVEVALPVHVDIIALAVESGGSLVAGITLCVDRTADGPLRRAWLRLLGELREDESPLEALRAMEQRLHLPAFSSLVQALRNAERTGAELAPVLRARARHYAAERFAAAERRARAAPLKLWATLVLCIAPCSLILLAFPAARMLAALWS